MKKENGLRHERPEDIIKPFDPIATDLIKQIYSACKDKNPEKYTSIESGLVDTIERECRDEELVFKRQISNILKGIKELISNDFGDNRYKQEFFRQLEEMIKYSQGSGNEEFLEDLTKVVAGLKRQQFDVPMPICYGNLSDLMICKKLISELEQLRNEIKQNLIHVEAINACIKNERLIVLVVNAQGQILFISKTGEDILKVKRKNLIGISIYDILNDFDNIDEFMNDSDEGKSKISLIPWDGINSLIPGVIKVDKIQGNSKNDGLEPDDMFVLHIEIRQ